MSDTQKERPASAVDKQTEAQIASVEFAEPLNRNAPVNAAVDIVLTMTDREGETQVWRAEYSNSYGTGNNASRTRAQMCVDALASIGWKGGHDFTDIDSVLVGRVVPISVRWTYSDNSGKWYKNVYLGHGGIRKMEKKTALDIIRAIAGGGSPAVVPVMNNAGPANNTATSPANPFAAPANPFAPKP